MRIVRIVAIFFRLILIDLHMALSKIRIRYAAKRAIHLSRRRQQEPVRLPAVTRHELRKIENHGFCDLEDCVQCADEAYDNHVCSEFCNDGDRSPTRYCPHGAQ